MGVIRGGLFIIISVLFFASLLTAGILWTVSLSLDYNIIKPELSSVVENLMSDNSNISQTVEEKLPAIGEHCENNSENSEFIFSHEDYVISIPCEAFNQGESALINETISDIVDDVYYKKYDCGFIHCFKEKMDQPFFLVSKMAKDYWANKLYIMLTISLILLILMFLLIENKINLAFVAGSLLIIASLFFTKLSWIFSFTSQKIFLQLISVFFTQSSAIFWRFFITGILVLSAGILIKFLGIGFKISEFIQKIRGNDPTKNVKTSYRRKSK
jgi:hypothetical protein